MAISDEAVLELYPDEHNKFVIICTAVSRKYIGKSNTMDNMVSYANEVEGRCRDELNLEVVCDISNMELDYTTGEWYSSPIVTPIKRLTPEIFDFARARYETQQGFVDGAPGKITEDGRWIEPGAGPISMPGAVDVAGD